MNERHFNTLVINSGSSSIKFAVYEVSENFSLQFSGKIDRIGLDDSTITINNSSNEKKINKIGKTDFHKAATLLIELLKKQSGFDRVTCVGHRIVHGLNHTEPQIIDERLIKELDEISSYDPDHLPSEIEIIRLLKKSFPDLIQVACFDTSFHTTIPAVANMFAIPRKFYNEGIRRYGFHGISYSYLMEELEKRIGEKAKGRIILAHLGNGVSLAAVKEGKCIDTTMGFTPTGGIAMSTRSGDLDPGIAWYLMQKGMNAQKFNETINHKSGLLGISETSSDMQDLLQKEKDDRRAADAINLFCYQVKKTIGAFTAALSGLDILIFSGGIGENASVIRSRICSELLYAGIDLDEEQNKKNAFELSTKSSAVKIYMIPTNEELMIAKSAADIYQELNYQNNNR